mmetsp:Transcript_10986/g.38668  ORF Transcript_10986/g.38668 Transcript_10986/m.38668 type:complete len:242 (-) Transcript_10986:3392-4117(-)
MIFSSCCASSISEPACSLQTEALRVVHCRVQQLLHLCLGLVLRQEEQVEASVRRRQPIGGLSPILLDHQLQFLQAAHWRQVAARDEREEAFLLLSIEGKEQTPEGDDVGRVLGVPVVNGVVAHLGEVQILLSTHDELQFDTVQSIEEGGVADASYAFSEGLELPLDARRQQPLAIKFDELPAVVQCHCPVLAIGAEFLAQVLAVGIVRDHEVQAEGVLEQCVRLLGAHRLLLGLPLQQRAQ